MSNSLAISSVSTVVTSSIGTVLESQNTVSCLDELRQRISFLTEENNLLRTANAQLEGRVKLLEAGHSSISTENASNAKKAKNDAERKTKKDSLIIKRKNERYIDKLSGDNLGHISGFLEVNECESFAAALGQHKDFIWSGQALAHRVLVLPGENAETAVKKISAAKSLIKFCKHLECVISHTFDKASFRDLPILEQANTLRKFLYESSQVANMDTLNLINKGITELPPEIGCFKGLRILNLRKNQLSSLPKGIGALKNLVTLDLTSNRFEKLPPIIGSLNLFNLYLDNNGLRSLPLEALSSIPLNSLGLSCNMLTSISPMIKDFVGLMYLNLKGNKLSSIPSEIGELNKLQTLVCSDNRLTLIPCSIGSLRELRTLSLNGNDLKIVPSSIDNLNPKCSILLYNNPKLKQLSAKLLKHPGLKLIPPKYSNSNNEIPNNLIGSKH